jgi:hypothetical protein
MARPHRYAKASFIVPFQRANAASLLNLADRSQVACSPESGRCRIHPALSHQLWADRQEDNVFGWLVDQELSIGELAF